MKEQINKQILEFVKEFVDSKFEFREHQLDIICQLVERSIKSYNQESNKNVSLLEAPTGSGKSIILMLAAGVLAKYYDMTSYILCSDLYLYKQYETFIYSHPNMVKLFTAMVGNDNYICERNGKSCSSPECRMAQVSWESLFDYIKCFNEKYECARNCEYIQKRKRAIRGPITVMTYQMYCALGHSSAETKNGWKKRNVTFCDECHNVPSIVQSCYSSYINDDKLTRLHNIYEYCIINKRNPQLFNDDFEDELYNKAIAIAPNIDALKENIDDIFNTMWGSDSNVVIMKNYRQLAEISHKFMDLSQDILDKFGESVREHKKLLKEDYVVYNDAKWVAKLNQYFTTLENTVKAIGEQYIVISKSTEPVIKPNNKVIISRTVIFNFAKENYLVHKYILERASHVIFTSATIGDFDAFMENTACNPDQTYTDRIPTNFDFSTSPIYAINRWKMSKYQKDISLPKVAETTYKICNNFVSQKGIIQTWSYDIAKYIYENAPENIKNRLLLYNDSSEKRDIIYKHQQSRKSTILIGPTLNEGIDLPGDLCKFIIITKIPYPYMGDKLVKAKIDLFPSWYDNETQRVLVQGIGRGNRFKEDSCKTYILDGCFAGFYAKTHQNWPDFIKKRIKFYK